MESILTKEKILGHLTVRCPSLECFDSIDSTNSYLKRAAMDGAIHKSIAAADGQNAGRGRMGRCFQSPAGKGLYLSVLLRPSVPAERLMRATGMAAVAAARAVETVSGAKVGIKWTNDLVLNGRKLCGILAETVMLGGETALIIGVGINVHHAREDFDGEVADIATSLAIEGYHVSRSALAAALIGELYRLGDDLGDDTGRYVEEYRSRCITLGQEVRLMWTEGQERAEAFDVDEAFGLVIRHEDGTTATVRTGEVSVRGLYGYAQ